MIQQRKEDRFPPRALGKKGAGEKRGSQGVESPSRLEIKKSPRGSSTEKGLPSGARDADGGLTGCPAPRSWARKGCSRGPGEGRGSGRILPAESRGGGRRRPAGAGGARVARGPARRGRRARPSGTRRRRRCPRGAAARRSGPRAAGGRRCRGARAAAGPRGPGRRRCGGTWPAAGGCSRARGPAFYRTQEAELSGAERVGIPAPPRV